MARKPNSRNYGQTRSLHPPSYSIARPRLSRPIQTYGAPRSLVLQTPRSDMRFHNPTWSVSAPAALNSNATRLKAVDKFGNAVRSSIPKAIGFTEPKAVALCVRRHQRREVLHALKKTGRHGARHTRRNKWSDVSC